MKKPTKAEIAEVNEVLRLAELIRPLLRGHSPTRQGAVLAECLAMWVAGHIAPDVEHIDRKATDELRERVLTIHVQGVRMLIPEAEEHLLSTLEGRKIWSNR